MRKDWYLYVLKLEGDNYYIGITTDLSRRMTTHFTVGGAKWTKLHKPLTILDAIDIGYVFEKQATTFEDRVTRLYMQKYGTDHVRGGTVCGIKTSQRRFSKFLSN